MTTSLSRLGFLLMAGGLVALMLRHMILSPAPLVIIIQIFAIALMIWARLTFGRRSFHANATPTEGGLVTTGPYHFIRHPIYASVCWFSWASALGHLSLFSVAMAAIVSVGAGIRMGMEETLLRTKYPAYVEYAARTKRFIPFVF